MERSLRIQWNMLHMLGNVSHLELGTVEINIYVWVVCRCNKTFSFKFVQQRWVSFRVPLIIELGIPKNISEFKVLRKATSQLADPFILSSRWSYCQSVSNRVSNYWKYSRNVATLSFPYRPDNNSQTLLLTCSILLPALALKFCYWYSSRRDYHWYSLILCP